MESTVVFLVIGVGIGAVVSYSRYSLRKNPTKKEPDRPFPHQWRELLVKHVEFYNRLTPPQRTKFEYRVHVFLLNVQIVGVETEVTHQDRILIAAGAIIPIFGFESWHYSNLKVVELYPDKFRIPNSTEYATGLVGWGSMLGKMKLSRKALIHGFYDNNDQKNVAIHEFVHVLDMQDGKIDGQLSKIMHEIDIKPWLQLIHTKVNDIYTGDSSIRDYGKTNNAEFLAVVSEFFFESPEKMKREHPDLYRSLDQFYNPKPKASVFPASVSSAVNVVKSALVNRKEI